MLVPMQIASSRLQAMMHRRLSLRLAKVGRIGASDGTLNLKALGQKVARGRKAKAKKVSQAKAKESQEERRATGKRGHGDREIDTCGSAISFEYHAERFVMCDTNHPMQLTELIKVFDVVA